MIDWFKQECDRRGLGVMQTLDQLARENDAYLAGWQESRTDVSAGMPQTLEQEVERLRKREAYFDKFDYWRKQAVEHLMAQDPERRFLGWSENQKSIVQTLLMELAEAKRPADTHPHDEVDQPTLDQAVRAIRAELLARYNCGGSKGYEVVGAGWYVDGVAQAALAALRAEGWLPASSAGTGSEAVQE